jgi:transposase
MARNDLSCVKKSEGEKRVIAYQDESALCQCPNTGSTSAPIGETPILRENDTNRYQRLSIRVFKSETRELFYEVREGNLNGTAIVIQLEKTFHRRWKIKYSIIWDGASIHTGQDIKDYLKQEEATERLYLVKIPPYSPKFNSVETFWAYFKGTIFKGIVPKNLAQLKEIVIEKSGILKKITPSYKSSSEMKKLLLCKRKCVIYIDVKC